MQSLQYAPSGSQTIAVWPETTSSFLGHPSSSYSMVLSSDYGLQEEVIFLTLLNTPSQVTPRMVFSLDRSTLPQHTGNYTILIRERLFQPAIWGELDITWEAYDMIWSDAYALGGSFPLDLDRAWVSGSDVPSTQQYTSPYKTGAYVIYY